MHRKIEEFLPLIVKSDELHAKLLNTFSFLEYIGFRKIVKSQRAEDLDCETLGHAIEEGRHALLLKKLAVKVGGSRFDSYTASELMAGEDAEDYFQSLDAACEKLLEGQIAGASLTRLTYLYVTWLIELRALSVYGAYQKAARENGMQPPLGGLLAEEDRHLEAVENELRARDERFARRSVEMKALEETFYQIYLLALSGEFAGGETAFGAEL